MLLGGVRSSPSRTLQDLLTAKRQSGGFVFTPPAMPAIVGSSSSSGGVNQPPALPARMDESTILDELRRVSSAVRISQGSVGPHHAAALQGDSLLPYRSVLCRQKNSTDAQYSTLASARHGAMEQLRARVEAYTTDGEAELAAGNKPAAARHLKRAAALQAHVDALGAADAASIGAAADAERAFDGCLARLNQLLAQERALVKLMKEVEASNADVAKQRGDTARCQQEAKRREREAAELLHAAKDAADKADHEVGAFPAPDRVCALGVVC